MMQSPSEREARRIKSLKKEYEAKGYSVEVEATRMELPRSLSAFCPDMIARKGNEVVIFEVKTQANLSKSSHLEEIAKQVNKMPGWRFELVVTNPKEPPEQIHFSSIHMRLEEAQKLMNLGYAEAGVLLLWSVVESSLRHIARQNKMSIKHDTPRLLVKKLYSNGLINQREFSSFGKLAQRRNVIAHGGERQKDAKTILANELEIVSRLLRREDMSR